MPSYILTATDQRKRDLLKALAVEINGALEQIEEEEDPVRTINEAIKTVRYYNNQFIQIVR